LIRVGLNACIAPVGSLPAWAAPALAIGTGAILYFFVDSQRYPAGLLAVMAGLAAGILVFGLPPIALGPVLPDLALPSMDDFSRRRSCWSFRRSRSRWPIRSRRPMMSPAFISRKGPACDRQGADDRAGHGEYLRRHRRWHACLPWLGRIDAHYRFGARRGAAVIFIGSLLLLLALVFGLPLKASAGPSLSRCWEL